MLFLIIILIIVLLISLFQFSDAKEKWNITEMASKTLNAKHGVHQLQKFQVTVFAIILAVLFVVVVLMATVFDSISFANHVVDTANNNKVDSLVHVYNLPPPDEKEKKIEITHLAYPGLEGYAAVNQVAQEEAQRTDESHSVHREVDNEPPTHENRNSSNDDVYAFEKQLFEETGGKQKREQIEKQRQETNQKKQEFERKRQEQLTKAGSTNATLPKGGKTMVSYSLTGRKPHNNNIYYVRNPGYTCEQGSYGEVVVNIKVDGMGNVTNATPKEAYSSLNPCLVEQAVKYAKLSKFDGSNNASQSGTITYQFVP